MYIYTVLYWSMLLSTPPRSVWLFAVVLYHSVHYIIENHGILPVKSSTDSIMLHDAALYVYIFRIIYGRNFQVIIIIIIACTVI